MTRLGSVLIVMIMSVLFPALADTRPVVAGATVGATNSTDFNGDGLADLATAAPEEDLGGISNVGAVEVLYGSAAGLTADGSQFWTAETPGVPGDADDGDKFGSSVGSGDFDADGYSDLA